MFLLKTLMQLSYYSVKLLKIMAMEVMEVLVMRMTREEVVSSPQPLMAHLCILM